MTYINPETVRSPKKSVRDVEVVFNSKPEQYSWSVATLRWNDEPSVGIRWNGNKKEKGSKGNPQSSGHSTWFIVPPALQQIILRKVKSLAKKQTLAAAHKRKRSVDSKKKKP
jgi:hypothetical protein